MRRTYPVPRRRLAAAVAGLLGIGLLGTVPGPAGGTVPNDPVVIAVGDLVCDPDDPNYNGGAGTPVACRHQATSDLAITRNPDAVLTLGDNQYENGARAKFDAAYHPTWGRLKSVTHPSPGNHDYGTGGAAGYFSYFGSAAGPGSTGWYSFDLGAWHLIALDSNCLGAGGCGVGSPQELWLRDDLARNAGKCTLAYWHHPRFSSGFYGNDPASDAWWRDLYTAGADVVLVGHEHTYERFARQNPSGAADPVRGLRQFVVGTGGADHHRFARVEANSLLRNSETFGVLELRLHPGGYDWQFLPTAGGTFTDSGSDTCKSANVRVALTDTPDPVLAGGTTTYRITVTNEGPDPATGARVIDQLPQGVTLVSTSPECSGADTITCDLGTMAPGASRTLSIVVAATTPGRIGNLATVSAVERDWAPADNSAVSVTTVCTLIGTSGDDVLTGTPSDDVTCGLGGNDRITGGGGRDLLIGGAGDDILDGGEADDTLEGEAGNDRIVPSWGDDVVAGGPGWDTIDLGWAPSGVVVDLAEGTATGGDWGSDQLSSIEAVRGSSAGDDTIIGNDVSNTLIGNGGNDTIRGGGGNDSIRGGVGRDVLYGGAGNDSLYGNSGDDRMWGEAGADRLDPGSGIDFASGGDGDDRLYVAERQRDSASGGGGNDYARYDLSLDTLSGVERREAS